MQTTTCLACGGQALEPLINLGLSPATTGALHPDAADARGVRRGEIDLVACRTCGHVANGAFRPELVDYDGGYDNSLHFSPAFQAFAGALAARLVAAYDLSGKHVVEIGSGRGDFLEALTRLGGATGTGYDPTYTPEGERPGVTLVPDYFRPAQHLAHYDMLLCRHVLEHLDDPFGMLASLRRSAPMDSVYYLEVPSAEFCFGPSGMWDCIYPHVSYFSATSLRRLVERAGFEVLALGSAFDGQFLWVEARPAAVAVEPGPPPAEVASHLELLRTFARRWAREVAAWREKIGAGRSAAALWGAGAKAVTFLHAADPAGRMVVVDINPRKWGRYLPGTAHVVRSPDSLVGAPIAEVLITNPVYRDEIAGHLRRIGVTAAVVSV